MQTENQRKAANTKTRSFLFSLAVCPLGIVLGTTRQTADVWIATLAILGHKGAEAVAVASTLLQLNMVRVFEVSWFLRDSVSSLTFLCDSLFFLYSHRALVCGEFLTDVRLLSLPLPDGISYTYSCSALRVSMCYSILRLHPRTFKCLRTRIYICVYLFLT